MKNINVFKRIFILLLSTCSLVGMTGNCGYREINGHNGIIKKIKLVDKDTDPKIRVEFDGDKNPVFVHALSYKIQENKTIKEHNCIGYLNVYYDIDLHGIKEHYKGNKTVTVKDISLEPEYNDENNFIRYNFLVTFDNKTAIILWSLEEGIHVGSKIKQDDFLGWSYIRGYSHANHYEGGF